jgi:hypothetical protein
MPNCEHISSRMTCTMCCVGLSVCWCCGEEPRGGRAERPGLEQIRRWGARTTWRRREESERWIKARTEGERAAAMRLDHHREPPPTVIAASCLLRCGRGCRRRRSPRGRMPCIKSSKLARVKASVSRASRHLDASLGMRARRVPSGDPPLRAAASPPGWATAALTPARWGPSRSAP